MDPSRIDHKPQAVGMSNSNIKLFTFMVLILTMAHWSACMWNMLPTLTEGRDSWLTSGGYSDLEAADKFVVGFYWATMTLTTIGWAPRTNHTHTHTPR